MSRSLNISISVSLILSVLALSACATKPETPPVATPAPVIAVAEKPSVPEAAIEPAPVAVTEQPEVVAQPAPKQAVQPVKKKVAKAKHTTPKVATPAPVEPPAPVEAPAPIAEPAVPPPQPSPPVTVTPPVQKIADESFLQQYWLWLLALGIAVAGVFTWWRMSQKPE
jgi:hypothetical protein